MEDKIVRYTLRVDRLYLKNSDILPRAKVALPTRKLSNILKRELPNLKKKTAKSKQRINKILISLKKRIELNFQSAFSLRLF